MFSDISTRVSPTFYYATDSIVTDKNSKEQAVEYWSDASGNRLDDIDPVIPFSPKAQELERLDGANTEELYWVPDGSGKSGNVAMFNSKDELKKS